MAKRPTHLQKKTRKKKQGPTQSKAVKNMNQKDPASWDEISNIQRLIVEHISSILNLNELIRDPKIREHLNHDKIETDYRIARKDIDEFFSPELIRLSERHKGRTGPVKDEHELMELINLFVEYETLVQRVDSVLVPTYLSLMNEVNHANNKVMNDPSNTDVITDVELKEVSDV